MPVCICSGTSLLSFTGSFMRLCLYLCDSESDSGFPAPSLAQGLSLKLLTHGVLLDKLRQEILCHLWSRRFRCRVLWNQTVFSRVDAVYTFTPCILRSLLIISSHLHRTLPTCIFFRVSDRIIV